MKDIKESLSKAAELARLKLSPEELAQFSKEAEEILKLFSQIDKIDTKGIEPAYQPVEISNVYREDKTAKCLPQKDALSNTTHKENGYFRGPKTI
jgi:aspartyl-tRNA(Asn)/glutamyl-tRNA(Gln) amidotransferase subunit C